MKKTISTMAAITLGFFSFSQSLEPTVIASSGTTFTHSTAKLDCVVGEVLTQTFSASGSVLTQGFLQPKLSISSLNEISSDYDVVLYPNPTTSSLHVAISGLDRNLQVELLSPDGKRLNTFEMSPILSNGVLTIDLSTYSNGLYLIRIHDGNAKGNLYQIIKQ